MADTIQYEIGMLLLRKIKDPRVKNVTVVGVKVTDDLRRAVVYYSLIGEEEADRAAAGLASAKGFIRSYLARELGMKYVPELEFKRDYSMSRQEEMERLLRELKENDDESGP